MIGQIILNSLALGSIYALTALGFVVIFRASDVVNFAQGEMMMLGAMVALLLYRNAHLGYVESFALAIVICMAAGAFVERIAFRPLMNAPHFTILLSTVAIGQIIRSAVRILFGQEVSSFPGVLSATPLSFLGLRTTAQNLGIVAVAFATLLAFVLVFSRTRIGWAMKAAAQNKRGAAIVGINVSRTNAQVWAMAGGLAAIAGILLAPLIIITPDMGVIGNKGFIAAILGGFTSLPGAVLGGFILALAENLIGVYISSAFKDAIVFVLLILVLVARPSGLLGRRVVKRV
ncbi:MAG TPA: branched-chain amino acid ABC transporter permease [Bradyrhizobium sp.]|nr:branched-chain amino acid ABC transporter permease [Bradyrhizobium sp.]